MVEEEVKVTRAAWEMFLVNNGLAYDSIKFKDGTPIYGWNIHHSVEIEPLYYPIENRIQFILTHKDESERLVRLKNMRPVSLESLKTIKFYGESIASAEKLYGDSIDSIAHARKLYNESTTSARKILDDSIAAAEKLLDDSIAAAKKLYEESIAPAWKLYQESVVAAHLADVPNHTWNGESIF
jgi:hypothetical protein